MKRLAFVLQLLLLLLIPRVGFAQSVTINQIVRGDLAPGRNVLRINHADCVRNGTVDVTLSVVTPDYLQLEAWAGYAIPDHCARDEVRNEVDVTTCWRVFSDEPRAAQTISLRIQDLIHPGGSGEGVCNQSSAHIMVLFMLVDGTVNRITNPPAVVFRYDLLGPAQPKLDGIVPGNERLSLEWTGSSAPDIEGYRIYCEPADSPELEPEAMGAGGRDETAALRDSACRGSTTLREGQVPDAQFEHGSASRMSTVGKARGLTNYVTYACGVAAYDYEGNVGALSNLHCAEPAPGREVVGCTCRIGRAPIPGLGPFLGLLGLVFALRRARGGSPLSGGMRRYSTSTSLHRSACRLGSFGENQRASRRRTFGA